MSLTIKTTGVILSLEVSDYLDKKLDDIETLIDPEDSSVQLQVELAKITEHHQSGEVFKAEFNLHIAGNNLYVVGTGQTLYAAIDEGKDKLLHELRVVKRKRLHFLRRGGAKVKALLKGLYKRDR